MENVIEITCDIHGSIFLSPEHHLRLASGCVECSPQSKKGDDKSFLRKLKSLMVGLNIFKTHFQLVKNINIL